MPNTGRPSRDCHSCRRRRVKCDLARPECGQCLRKGQSCPGYRDELEIRFRREGIGSFQAHQGRDNRRKPRGQHDGSENSLRHTTSHGHLRGESPVQSSDQSMALQPAQQPYHYSPLGNTLYTLSESWESHIMPLVVNNLSFDMGKSVFNSIPYVASKAEEGSALYLACNAVGRAYIANSSGSPNAVEERTKAYGAALAGVSSALRNPQQYNSDNTLLGVWLLSLYELLLGAKQNEKAQVAPIASPAWDAHTQGLLELIRRRGKEGFAMCDRRNLFWVVLNTVQIRALISGQESPKELIPWLEEIYQHCDPSEYIVIRASIFAHHCTQLCSRIRTLIESGDREGWLSQARAILLDMDAVETKTYPLSDAKPITDCVIEPPLTPYSGSEKPSLRSLGIYVYNGNSRMQVSYHVLQYLTFASEDPSCTPTQRHVFEHFRSRCIQEFRAVANKILYVLATSLDIEGAPIDLMKGPRDEMHLSRIVSWPDAIRVLWPIAQWPLRFLAVCPASMDWQKDAAMKILETMNKQLGIMRALGTLYFSGMKLWPQSSTSPSSSSSTTSPTPSSTTPT